jgi:hypothetical protein
MNPFRKLGQLVNWVLGADLSEPAPPAPRPPPPRRTDTSGPDGFDPPKRAPLTWRTPFEPRAEPSPEEPLPEPTPVPPTAFMASLDDIDLVDDPLEPRPEFIPKGGMSTESLMREFDSLDPELRGAASVEAPAVEPRDTSTEALMAELAGLTPAPQEPPLQDVDVSAPGEKAIQGDAVSPVDVQPPLDGAWPVELPAANRAHALEVISLEPPDVPLQRTDVGHPAEPAIQSDAPEPPLDAPVEGSTVPTVEKPASAVEEPTAAKDDGLNR